MTSLTGKLALVTGASRGLGKAIATQLAMEGSYVIGTATSLSGAESITRYLEEQGLAGEGLVLELSSKDAIDAFIVKLTEENKLPAILVNNAGITADNLLLRMEDEAWCRVLETNLTSIFRLTKACLKPMFRARFGRIINLSSVVAATGNSGQCNYAAAKAGIIGFTKSLAQEMASRGITANVVAPGFIDTDMTQGLPDLVKEETLKRIPMKRLGRPDEIASMVTFLSSDKAAYITGQCFHVNGGMYMN